MSDTNPLVIGSPNRRGTRHGNPIEDEAPISVPRLGRRESEPHSIQINSIYDVLETNFPGSRVMWDLHHYFQLNGERVDLQFDISFFLKFDIPCTLSSYDAKEYDNRIPDMAINILSSSTWKNDLGINRHISLELGIPLYVIFNTYLTDPKICSAPFLQIARQTSNGNYETQTLRKLFITETGKVDPEALLDVTDRFPFKLGICKLPKIHKGGLGLYELVFIDPKTSQILKSRAGQAENRAEQAENRAEQAENRAEQAENRAEQAENRAEQAENRAEQAQGQVEEERRAREEAERRAEQAEAALRKFKAGKG